MCDLIVLEAFSITNKMRLRQRSDSWPDNDSADRFLMEMRMVRRRLLKKFLFNSFTALVDYSAELKDFVKTPAFQIMSSCVVFDLFSKTNGPKKKVDFGFFFLSRSMATAEIVAEMKKRNLRPANFQELMYFSQRYIQLLKLFELSSPAADYQERDNVYFARVVARPGLSPKKKPYIDVHIFSHYQEPKEKIIWHPDAQVILGVYLLDK